MKITLSKYAGFCEGVDRAYHIVEAIMQKDETERPVAVLGSLVHNEEVVKKIEDLGVSTLSIGESLEETLEKASKICKTLVITAHGMGPEVYDLAKKTGLKVVDTTCPKVIKVQRLAKTFFDRRYQIVMVGEKNHKEVKGICEWAQNSTFLIENDAELESLKLDPKKPIVVLSQTTQDKDFVEKAANYIKKNYPNVNVIDSICDTTHKRQSEVKELAKTHDVVVVIGSPQSANSTQLWNIAKRINENSFFVKNASELEARWFQDRESIAVTAGASTPSWIIKEIMEMIGKSEIVKSIES